MVNPAEVDVQVVPYRSELTSPLCLGPGAVLPGLEALGSLVGAASAAADLSDSGLEHPKTPPSFWPSKANLQLDYTKSYSNKRTEEGGHLLERSVSSSSPV